MTLSSPDLTSSSESLLTLLDRSIANAKEFLTGFDRYNIMNQQFAEPPTPGDYNHHMRKRKKRKYSESKASEVENLSLNEVQDIYEKINLKIKKKKHHKSFKDINDDSVENVHNKMKKKKRCSLLEDNTIQEENDAVDYLDDFFLKQKKKHKKTSELEVKERSNNEDLNGNLLKKKKKHKGSSISEGAEIAENHPISEIEDLAKKKKKNKHKHFTDAENDQSLETDIGSVGEIKKKKKHKESAVLESDAAMEENQPGKELDYLLGKKKKKKHKQVTGTDQGLQTDIRSVGEIKKKHKEFSVLETDAVMEEHQPGKELEHLLGKKKKKKHKEVTDTETDQGLETDVGSISEIKEKHLCAVVDHLLGKKKKKKHKHLTDVKNDQSLETDLGNVGEIKKKKKHKESAALKSDAAMEANQPGKELHHLLGKKKKKRHKQVTDTETDQSIEIVVEHLHEISKNTKESTTAESDAALEEHQPGKELDHLLEKKKHKQVTETGQGLETDIGDIKKKRKESSILESDAVLEENHPARELNHLSGKKKKKHKQVTDTQTDTSLETNEVNLGEIKKKHKESNILEGDTVLEENHPESSIEDIMRNLEVVLIEAESDENVDAIQNGNLESKSSKNRERNYSNFGRCKVEKDSPGSRMNKRVQKGTKLKNSSNLSDNDTTDTSVDDSFECDAMPNSLQEAVETIDQLNEYEFEDRVRILTGFHVMISWEIPESHKIEKRLSHPTSKQIESLRDLKVHSRLFSKQEDSQIRANWVEFCKVHDLKQVSPTIFFPSEVRGLYKCFPTNERLKFGQYLAKDLPHRSLYSVYNRFQLLFTDYKKGPFTPEENETIMTFVKCSNSPRKFSILAKILNRPRGHIRQHYLHLKAQKNVIGDAAIVGTSKKEKSVKWDEDTMNSLVKHLLDVTKQNNIQKLEQFAITTKHWKEVASRMHFSARPLKQKWNLDIYPGLFVRNYKSINEIQEKLINILNDSGISDPKHVKWLDLSKEFPGLTRDRLYKIFVDLRNRIFIEDHRPLTFREQIGLLKQHVETKHQKIRPLLKCEWDNLLGELRFS